MAARVIHCVPKRDHITPYLSKLHWLPVRSRIIYKILLYVYKILNGLAPAYLADLVRLYTPRRTLRSEGSLSLCVPSSKTVTFGDKAFTVAGPVLWNKLPLSIRNAVSVSMFKKALKTHLFQEAYGLES